MKQNKVTNYERPTVKVILTEVEQGFAVSAAGTEQYTSAGTFDI